MRVEPEADDARSADLDVVSAGEFLRASPDPTITVAHDGTIRTANPAVETVLGHAPGTLVGEPVTRLLPDRFFETAAEIASEYLETGQSPVGTRNFGVFPPPRGRARGSPFGDARGARARGSHG
jgi:PAS domain-containing protein